MAIREYNAIIVCDPQPVTGNRFLRYKKINNKDRFLKFAAKFPGVKYINFYDNLTKSFVERIYLE